MADMRAFSNCTYFLRGTCKNEGTCPFKHDEVWFTTSHYITLLALHYSRVDCLKSKKYLFCLDLLPRNAKGQVLMSRIAGMLVSFVQDAKRHFQAASAAAPTYKAPASAVPDGHCFFFLKGPDGCNKGDECKFIHDEVRNISIIPCCALPSSAPVHFGPPVLRRQQLLDCNAIRKARCLPGFLWQHKTRVIRCDATACRLLRVPISSFTSLCHACAGPEGEDDGGARHGSAARGGPAARGTASAGPPRPPPPPPRWRQRQPGGAPRGRLPAAWTASLSPATGPASSAAAAPTATTFPAAACGIWAATSG